ncbi:hypothetical protein [Amycolatopsis pithecellobii]|nr:hypothetical protein [Amycolatopsis pithecellobii]
MMVYLKPPAPAETDNEIQIIDDLEALSEEVRCKRLPGLGRSRPAAIDVFVAALTTMWNEIAREQLDEDWKQTLARAARTWKDHRSATCPTVLV